MRVFHASPVTVRLDHYIPPILDCLTRLFIQHLKRLEDIRLLGALRPNGAANTNYPIQISLRKCDVVPRRQPNVKRPIECVELFWSKGPCWAFKSEHTQGEAGRRDEPKVIGLLDKRDKGVTALDCLHRDACRVGEEAAEETKHALVSRGWTPVRGRNEDSPGGYTVGTLARRKTSGRTIT